MAGLYWTGGDNTPKIFCEIEVSKSTERAATKVLDDFLSDCQYHWIAFNGSVNGRFRARKRLLAHTIRGFKGTLIRLCPIHRLRERLLMNNKTEGTTYVAVAPPQGYYYGNPVVAQIGTSELIAAMEKGGAFEHLNSKALVVLIYSLWEESARYELASILKCKREQIECGLMGDIRLLRNVIVHRSDESKRDYQEKAEFLPLVWGDIDLTELPITDDMIYELMWQLNAIQVNILNPKQRTEQMPEQPAS